MIRLDKVLGRADMGGTSSAAGREGPNTLLVQGWVPSGRLLVTPSGMLRAGMLSECLVRSVYSFKNRKVSKKTMV